MTAPNVGAGTWRVHLGIRATGDRGAIQTLKRMRKLVNASLTDPNVYGAAGDIVTGCPDRDRRCQVAALRAWSGAHLRFINDPKGVEVLETPASMLETIRRRGFTRGDCDNAAVLTAALGKAIGIGARFVILGFITATAPYSHVYTELDGGGGWREMDVTRPSGLARIPYTRRHVMEV